MVIVIVNFIGVSQSTSWNSLVSKASQQLNQVPRT